MKKSPGPKLAEVVSKIEERLAALEGKIDTLLSRSAQPARPPQRPQHQDRPQFNNAHQHRHRHQHGGNQHNNFNQRKLFRVICADCNKPCEVPFRPNAGRPVYCKECFARRRAGGAAPQRERREERPQGKKFFDRFVSGKKRGDSRKRKSGKGRKKKKASSRSRKKRARK